MTAGKTPCACCMKSQEIGIPGVGSEKYALLRPFPPPRPPPQTDWGQDGDNGFQLRRKPCCLPTWPRERWVSSLRSVIELPASTRSIHNTNHRSQRPPYPDLWRHSPSCCCIGLSCLLKVTHVMHASLLRAEPTRGVVSGLLLLWKCLASSGLTVVPSFHQEAWHRRARASEPSQMWTSRNTARKSHRKQNAPTSIITTQMSGAQSGPWDVLGKSQKEAPRCFSVWQGEWKPALLTLLLNRMEYNLTLKKKRRKRSSFS